MLLVVLHEPWTLSVLCVIPYVMGRYSLWNRELIWLKVKTYEVRHRLLQDLHSQPFDAEKRFQAEKKIFFNNRKLKMQKPEVENYPEA